MLTLFAAASGLILPTAVTPRSAVRMGVVDDFAISRVIKVRCMSTRLSQCNAF